MAVTNLPYNDYTTFLRRHFDVKVQKLTVNAGFTCPNRDGTVGWGGCTYCNNQTFNPAYCRTERSVTEQLKEGKHFFARKYPDMRYLAYFQAYTNTYASLPALQRLYEEALAVDGVVGLVIGTRPDCMPASLLFYLEQLARHTFVLVEYGIESTRDDTLRRINRGHTMAVTTDAVERTAACGIPVGGHVILGLPGEDDRCLMRQARDVSALPLTLIKMHQLQLVRGTRMAAEFQADPSAFRLYTADEYVDVVVGYLRRLRPSLVVERFVSQSPRQLLLAPDWGLKNYEFTARVVRRMQELGARQGDCYEAE